MAQRRYPGNVAAPACASRLAELPPHVSELCREWYDLCSRRCDPRVTGDPDGPPDGTRPAGPDPAGPGSPPAQLRGSEPIGLPARSSSRAAGDSYTATAPASRNSSSCQPPQVTAAHGRPARAAEATSQPVSPTKTARSASSPDRSSATCTMSGAGLLSSTSPAEVAAVITSSAS